MLPSSICPGNHESPIAQQVLQVQEAFPGLQGRLVALWIAAQDVKNHEALPGQIKSQQGFLFAKELAEE
jgi:hypothetical protein